MRFLRSKKAKAGHVEREQVRIVVFHLLGDDQQSILFSNAFPDDHAFAEHGFGDGAAEVLPVVLGFHTGRQLDRSTAQDALFVPV